MNKRDNFLYLILESVSKTKGWGLFLERGMNIELSSKFLDQLEKSGYIIINGKDITDDGIINYHYLEFTNKGSDLYIKMKNSTDYKIN